MLISLHYTKGIYPSAPVVNKDQCQKKMDFRNLTLFLSRNLSCKSRSLNRVRVSLSLEKQNKAKFCKEEIFKLLSNFYALFSCFVCNMFVSIKKILFN